MSDRQPEGGGNQSPGKGSDQRQPPRKGLFARNPFLFIILILAAAILGSAIWGTGRAVELTYDQFKAELRAMATLNEGRYPPERGAEPPIEDPEKQRVLDPKQDTIEDAESGDGPRFGIYQATIQPDKVLGKLFPAPDSKNLPKGWDSKRITGDSKWDGFIQFVVEHQGKDDELISMLESKGAVFKYDRPTDWATMWLWGLPLLFFIFIMMMMFRSSRMQGENVLSFGRSRAKIVGEDKTGVTFGDVAGADEPKEELEEIVEFLKEPERFTSLGGKIPKGCLLMGPPGCGKTLLARAVAGEAAVPFFSISGSDFVEMFVGVGAARVRDLFNTAKQKAPCIVFVDEIDAVGRHRGAGLGGGHDEREQTLNQLLVEMDGFDGRKGVIVIAATNRPDILDPALLRPGRFDRQVTLDAPDLAGRHAILKIHSRGKPLADDVDLEIVARRTPGFTGADLANVMNEAALLSARRRHKEIGRNECEEAVERVVAGPERRSRIIKDAEKRILAFHELGHALVARFSERADPVHKVSIIPRGRGALGYTLTLPEEDRYIITKDELMARIRVTMGGRSAEEVVFGHQSTGAEDDLQKATSLARSLVCRWGMTDALGPMTYDRSPGNPVLGREMANPDVISEKTAGDIDRAVRDIIETCHKEAVEIITKNRDLIDKLADHLIENEVLDLMDFEAAVQNFATVAPPPLRKDLLKESRKPDEDLPDIDSPPMPEPPPISPSPLPQGA
ncbi:MAG: ATP-dependent zinc metalloprotease FtsH [Planctomycetota bacterium]|nr:ATP-dependent zinc metalloprotease FtsH [Planctomycetota bacterium]